MENKYYTPEISEFYVGFEYEYLDNNLKTWKPNVIESYMLITPNIGEACDSEITEIFRELKEGNIRVKYLDREDIEELGFSKRSKGTWAGFIDYEYNTLIDGEVDYFLRASIHIPVMGDRWRILLHRNLSDDTNIDNKIKEAESAIVFEGKIKNKSELKRVLKQVGVL